MSHAADAPARASIRLGPMLGRGGEGAVYAIEGRPDQVAKIYSTTPDERKVRKLRAMTKAASPRLLKVAAWPTALITKKGSVCGFVMPRVAARRGIHELYSPKSRSEVFPEVDFRFLVHTASNIARAFAVVHEHGHVLGDVNQSNLLVGPDGTAMLIDCDSFQITTVEVFFTCDVGVPLFTPPELHGIPFRGLRRTANHDCFGLAVLLFHLLFMGRHPFAGRYLGPGDMPIERAIAEYRFAYGPDRNSYRMERPPGTISLETMEPAFAAFTNAFGRAGSTGGRPDAKSWVATLERLKAELAPCQRATWHHYPRALRSCPWCEIEAQTGVRLFGQKIATVGTTGRIDVARLWEAMVAVADPGEEPVLPSERTWRAHAGARVPSGMGKALRKALGVAFVCAGLVACNVLATDGGIVLALLTYGIAFAVWPRVSSEKLAAANAHVASVRAEWEAVVAQWQREASRKVFAITLRALEKARDEVGDLTNERGRRLARLRAEREERQRQRYLDRFRIDRTRIRGIGAGRTAMLASYGIETAADIDGTKILQIPGFGETLTIDLVRWRRQHERSFRFNPNEPIDPSDVAAMDRELEARKQTLLSALEQGPAQLRRISQGVSAARQRLMPPLEKTWTALKLAEARRDVL